MRLLLVSLQGSFASALIHFRMTSFAQASSQISFGAESIMSEAEGHLKVTCFRNRATVRRHKIYIEK
jgi:hypothetical protein